MAENTQSEIIDVSYPWLKEIKSESQDSTEILFTGKSDNVESSNEIITEMKIKNPNLNESSESCGIQYENMVDPLKAKQKTSKNVTVNIDHIKAPKCEICKIYYCNKHVLKKHTKTHEINKISIPQIQNSKEGKTENEAFNRMKNNKQTSKKRGRHRGKYRDDTEFIGYLIEKYKIFESKNNSVIASRWLKAVHEYNATYNDELDGRQLASKWTNKKYLSKKHEGIKHRCESCGQEFTMTWHLNKHIKIVHEGKRHRCEKCGKEFGQMNNLNRHVRTVHEGRKDYKCGTCGKEFGLLLTLKQHIIKVHKVDKKDDNIY